MAQSSPTPAEKTAMERAQREADGPRRRILEAAKVKGTVRSDMAGTTPAVTTAVTAPAAAPTTAQATPSTAVAATAANNTPSPAAGNPAVVARQAPPPRDEPPPAERSLALLPGDAAPVPMPSSAVTAVPMVSQVELATASVALAAMPAPRQPPPPLQLVTRVDPELPSRLQRRGARRTTLMVDLTVARDGSVSKVSVRKPVDEDLEASVREAVSQWRYAPLPEARQHALQLVLGGAD